MENIKPAKRVKTKKKLGSYPYFSVIFSITLALFVIGLFGLLLLHTQNLQKYITENVEIQVYLNKFVTDNDKFKINKTLATKDFVIVKDGEAQITFISKEEAAEQTKKDIGHDFVEFLGENPLHDAFTLKLKPEYQTSEHLREIKEDIESMPGIYEVSFVESYINNINENVRNVGLILISFAVILLATVFMLINNTIKLALFSQRFLIRSMQLVGATASFIQKPFVIRATFHGFLAGILACLLLITLMVYTNKNIQDLSSLQDNEQISTLFIFIIFSGAILGLFSTYSAVKKYLKMSLDDLY